MKYKKIYAFLYQSQYLLIIPQKHGGCHQNVCCIKLKLNLYQLIFFCQEKKWLLNFIFYILFLT
jgi:hypothetical protein